uniref:Potassium channel blocker pMeKTx9-2 n=1 Tax=Mesobuthus eupeus TaxID=34648 RepID=A0A088DB13_MESEU|nr:potassium channel blocker pMeKTx9-2 [Mesobuthus eupeus]
MKNYCGIIILFLAIISATGVFCVDFPNKGGKCHRKECRKTCKKLNYRGKCFPNYCRCYPG